MQGVVAARPTSVSLNFGVSEPFAFDVTAFEREIVREQHQLVEQGSTLSDFYMHHVYSSGPVREQKLNTKYLSPDHYSKKDTYSLFSSQLLLHQTLMIMEPKYKSQGRAIMSDDDSDSESEST